MSKQKYNITLKNNNTIKQMVDRYYILPKEPKNYEYKEQERDFLESKALKPTSKDVLEGKDGYIVFRGKKPKKLNDDQIQGIQESLLIQRQLAKMYGVSVATINKVKNNKY